MLRMIARVLRVLNSEASPIQISLALCLSMVAGLTPLMSPHNLLVLFLALTIRVNLSAFILGLVLFSGLAYLLDPLFNLIGLSVLTAAPLEGLWTGMYNSTFWRLVNFNNSIVMGSLLFSAALFVPMLLVLNALIRKYRENVLGWVRKTHVMQALKATKLYRVYSAYSEYGGGL